MHAIGTGVETPWLGITERINIYAYLLWMAVLAVTLLRQRARREPLATGHATEGALARRAGRTGGGGNDPTPAVSSPNALLGGERGPLAVVRERAPTS